MEQGYFSIPDPAFLTVSGEFPVLVSEQGVCFHLMTEAGWLPEVLLRINDPHLVLYAYLALSLSLSLSSKRWICISQNVKPYITVSVWSGIISTPRCQDVMLCNKSLHCQMNHRWLLEISFFYISMHTVTLTNANSFLNMLKVSVWCENGRWRSESYYTLTQWGVLTIKWRLIFFTDLWE